MEKPLRSVHRAALKDAIRLRAQELYKLRGCKEGHALEDWLQAEAEVMRELAKKEEAAAEASNREAAMRNQQTLGPSRIQETEAGTAWVPRVQARKRGFFNVKVDHVLYTVQYNPEQCDCYRPGMLQKGQPVELRFEDDKIFLKLPNSKELEAKIVSKAQA